MPSEAKDSIFDWDGLLNRLMGDEDLAREIIDDFLEQIPDNLFAVKEALKNKDLPLDLIVYQSEKFIYFARSSKFKGFLPISICRKLSGLKITVAEQMFHWQSIET